MSNALGNLMIALGNLMLNDNNNNNAVVANINPNAVVANDTNDAAVTNANNNAAVTNANNDTVVANNNHAVDDQFVDARDQQIAQADNPNDNANLYNDPEIARLLREINWTLMGRSFRLLRRNFRAAMENEMSYYRNRNPTTLIRDLNFLKSISDQIMRNGERAIISEAQNRWINDIRGKVTRVVAIRNFHPPNGDLN